MAVGAERRGHRSWGVADIHIGDPFSRATIGRNKINVRNSCADGFSPLQYAPLPSRTSDPILCLCLDRPATIGEVAPYFLPHGAAYLLRQCRERLASGSSTAFKRAVIGIERKQHESVLDAIGLEIRQSGLIEQRPQTGRFAERESARDGLGQTWRVPGDDLVDLMIVGALDDGIHRDGDATAGTQHATKL